MKPSQRQVILGRDIGNLKACFYHSMTLMSAKTARYLQYQVSPATIK